MTRKKPTPASNGAEDWRRRMRYFPLYVADWLLSDAVDGFTLEQQGAYVRLLLAQWTAKDGRLPRDEAELARVSRLGAQWDTVGRPILDRCFVRTQGGYINLRCWTEWNATRSKIQKAIADGRDGARRRWENG